MKKYIFTIILILSLSSLAFADPFATGVVGRWKLSENAGNTAGWLDLSANGNDLTGVNTPTAGNGHTTGVGDAVQLTSASSQELKILFASATGLHSFASAFTFSVWLNTDSTSSGEMAILGTWGSSPNQSYTLVVDGTGLGNTVGLFISNNGTSVTEIHTTTSTVVGTWVHIFVVWTGTQLEMYTNNVSDATPVAFTGGPFSTNNDWCIGAQSGCNSFQFDGRVDDVTIWNRALTSGERTDVFIRGTDFTTGSEGIPAINGSDLDSILSLNAVIATGVGTSNFLKGSRCSHTWFTGLTGAPSAATILLEGSIDNGTTFFTLDTSTAIVAEMRHVVNKCVDTIRSNLTVLTGGTSPTITTTIQSTK